MTSTTLQRSEKSGLSAIVEGSGQPVLLLHGVGLRADAWGAQIETLRGNHLIVAPDMPGHGQTPLAARCEVLEDYVLAALPLLRELPTPALVVGHSMGAMIALELARLAPDHVAGVVALNAIFERSNTAKDAVRARAASLDDSALPDPTPTLTRWFGAAQSPARTACESCLRAADPLGYKRAYTAFAHADGPRSSDLQALACPALFATGALEPNSTPEMSRQMAKLAPQGQALVVEGAAHMMPMTHAAEVNSALQNFIHEVWK